MNILLDYHQSSLFNSLQLLFEKRLKHTVVRPIGMEWYEQGYWKINDLRETAIQYLDIGSQPLDGTPPLNDGVPQTVDDGVYKLLDHHNESTHLGVTLARFMAMPIDIVIATIPQHIEPFTKLAELKGAKFIMQCGNDWSGVDFHGVKNFMVNTAPNNLPLGSLVVNYHQEFPLDVFYPTTQPPDKQITSFINVYQKNAGYVDYATLKSMMPSFVFKSYGGQCDDGTITGITQMASIMRNSYFGFHSKWAGDGYGHTLYNWFACGRPIITRIADYEGKLGKELLINDETCLDIDKYGLEGIKLKVENLSPDIYNYMCQQVTKRFLACVDFDKEEKVSIRRFLDTLQ